MKGFAQRPWMCLVVALGAQVLGVCLLALLQFSAFVAPPRLGEASAVGVGYAVLIVASAVTWTMGAIAAYVSIQRLTLRKAVPVVALCAAPLVFVGMAEFYATLAMLGVF